MTVVAFAFGSLGDILAAAGLAVQIIKALYGCVGCSDLLEELQSLYNLLLYTEQVLQIYQQIPTCRPLVGSIHRDICKCRSLMADFASHLDRFRQPLNLSGLWHRTFWIVRQNSEASSLKSKLAFHRANVTTQLQLLSLTVHAYHPSNMAGLQHSSYRIHEIPSVKLGPSRGLSYITNEQFPVGTGIARLQQFSQRLAHESPTKLQVSYWEEVVTDYFTPQACLNLLFWKDGKSEEVKPINVDSAFLARFFLATMSSGARSMTISADGAREVKCDNGDVVVECPYADWSFKYANGYLVSLKGPLTCNFEPVLSNTRSYSAQPASFALKFNRIKFDAHIQRKLRAFELVAGDTAKESDPPIASSPPLESSETLPEYRVDDADSPAPLDPVNAFGVPPATMRCLELGQQMWLMADLMSHCNERKLGPIEGLQKLAAELHARTR